MPVTAAILEVHGYKILFGSVFLLYKINCRCISGQSTTVLVEADLIAVSSGEGKLLAAFLIQFCNHNHACEIQIQSRNDGISELSLSLSSRSVAA